MHSTFDGFVSLFLERAQRDGARTFATWDAAALSFAEIERQSRAFACHARRLGLKAGDRVAIMLPNSPAVMAALYGIARSGLVWVPVNPDHRGASLAYLLEHSRPSMIVVDEAHEDALAQCGASLDGIRQIVVRKTGDALAALLEGDPADTAVLPQRDDVFAIMYTSGTTGRPKGVLVTHRMMRFAAEAAIRLADARDGDVLFMWEPLYHIGGAQVLLMPLLRELRLALVKRFSASHFWEQVRDAGATHIHYLGGVLQILMKQPAGDRDRAHSVRVGWGAGCLPDTWDAFRQRFGIELREAYGMTETSSIASINESGQAGSVGHAVPWFDIEVVNAQGQPVPRGERGEIVVRPKEPGCIFPGYFRDPQTTAHVLRDGVVHTQDIGSFDASGALTFHGRMTDSIRCRGENVSAWEIEHVLSTHEAVEDCAVIGVEAEVGEQDIKLFVQFKTGRAIGPAELSGWLAERLAPFQNPRYIQSVAEFARTPSQRIIKHVLPTSVAASWDRLSDAAKDDLRPSDSPELAHANGVRADGRGRQP